jgi:hypothetical protein
MTPINLELFKKPTYEKKTVTLTQTAQHLDLGNYRKLHSLMVESFGGIINDNSLILGDDDSPETVNLSTIHRDDRGVITCLSIERFPASVEKHEYIATFRVYGGSKRDAQRKVEGFVESAQKL